MQIRQIGKLWEEEQKINANCYFEQNEVEIDVVHNNKETERLFNKMIILLKNTSRNMTPLIDDSEENWILYNTFMHNKKVIENQIDVLLKEKKRIKKILYNI